MGSIAGKSAKKPRRIDRGVDITEVRRQALIAARLSTLKRSVYSRLGELLAAKSTASGGHNSYLLRVRCVRQHEFLVKSRDLMRGIWCPECAEIERSSLLEAALERMRKHASEQGGACHADTYTTARQPVPWECHRAHTWNASWDNVRNKKSWCPVCAVDRR